MDADQGFVQMSEDPGRILELCLADPGLLEDVAEMGLMQRGLKLLKPRCVLVDEFMIENFAWPPLFCIQHFLHQSLQQSYVAAYRRDCTTIRRASFPKL